MVGCAQYQRIHLRIVQCTSEVGNGLGAPARPALRLVDALAEHALIDVAHVLDDGGRKAGKGRQQLCPLTPHASHAKRHAFVKMPWTVERRTARQTPWPTRPSPAGVNDGGSSRVSLSLPTTRYITPGRLGTTLSTSETTAVKLSCGL
jgi:hypothetical protein